MHDDDKSPSNPGLEAPRAVPGPRSKRYLDVLARHECPAITARRARREGETGLPQDPIVWESGSGAWIRDVDGQAYLDFTAAFAVAAYGHAHPALTEAAAAQAKRLMHGMGDVYPTDVKIEFAERLADTLPARLEQSIFGLNGSDAVEAALKTAKLATGRGRVLAFWGGYHGMSLGALGVTAYRDSFRAPFHEHLSGSVSHAPYPDCYRCPLKLERATCGLACLEFVRQAAAHPAAGHDRLGAVIVEPVQGRGGYVVPPTEWLVGLRAICDEHDLVLIYDEIYTGFGRTGARFAMEHAGVEPDIVCLGKAMTGGFPMSAAVGTREVMSSWGNSKGEALHTSTFLGNPMGCAVGLAALELFHAPDFLPLIERVATRLRDGLSAIALRHADTVGCVRGLGLMQGLELVSDPVAHTPATGLAAALMRWCLERGLLVLPGGVHGQLLALSPPLVVDEHEVDLALNLLDEGLSALAN